MLRKLILAILASLFTTAGMMLIYKAYEKNQYKKKPKIETNSDEDLTILPQYQKALKELKTVSPHSTKEFPPELLFILDREKCRIPIVANSKNPQGWIKGHFASPEQTDYAVLCITPANELTIKVNWGGTKRPCSISLGYGLTSRYILTQGKEDFAFSRFLQKAGTKRVGYYAYQQKIKRPTQVVEGIEDTLLNHSSQIYYCVDKEWVTLPTK